MGVKQTTISIQGWLLSLVAITSIPLLLFSFISISQFGNSVEKNSVEDLDRRTESLRNAIDERFKTTFTILNAIATSDAARKEDLTGLYEYSRRVLRTNPEYRAISLVNKNEEFEFITLAPMFGNYPPPGDLASVRRVFASNSPNISSVYKSPISNRFITTINVPVEIAGEVKYCLRMVLLADSWNKLISNESLPQQWVASITSRDSLIVARSHDPGKYVGTLISKDVRKALSARQKLIFEGYRSDGIKYQNVVLPVNEWSGWSVVVGIPLHVLHSPLKSALESLFIIGGVFVFLSIVAALIVTRQVNYQFKGMVDAATALLNNQDLKKPHINIRELVHLQDSMLEFSRRHHKASKAMEDISAENIRTRTALEQSRIDPLTGLAGRAFFMERLELVFQEISLHKSRHLALLFIDLDNFKQVNDTLGHAEGDKVLLKAARIFKTAVRETDVAGRLGGDEFVIAVIGSDADMRAQASILAGRIIQNVALIGNGIGCSIGIALMGDECATLDALMKNADEAMYQAKRAGKNRFAVHEQT